MNASDAAAYARERFLLDTLAERRATPRAPLRAALRAWRAQFALHVRSRGG